MTGTLPSYDLFISYSHAADAELAIAVETALQSFGRTALERRRITVFRDESQLSLAPDLWGRIEAALRVSRCFLFLASEHAARSPWVAREIECWKSLHRAERLFIVWTDGILRWRDDSRDFDWSATTCLPRALAGVFSGEPLHLDLRWARGAAERQRESGRFLRDVARIVAAIWERPVEDVYGEELRRHREMLARESTLLAERIRADYEADPERAVLLALEAYNSYVATPRAELALNTALDASRLRNSWTCRPHPSLAIAPDRERMLIIGEDSAHTFDLRTATSGAVCELPEGSVGQVVFRSDAVLVLIRRPDGSYVIVDAVAGGVLRAFDLSQTDLVALSSDGSLIAMARTHRGQDRGIVDVVEMEGLALRASITGYPEGLISIDFAAGDRRLVTRSYEAFTRIWDLETAKFLAEYEESGAELAALEISPDGETLAVYVRGGGYVRVVDAATGRQRGTLSEMRGGVGSVRFAPRARLIATSDHDGAIRAFDSATLVPRWTIQAGRDALVRGMSADGSRLLSTTPGAVQLWNTQTGARICDFRPHDERMIDAHFVHDETAIVTSSESRLRLWDARQVPSAVWDIAICEDEPGSIYDMALGNDGHQLAVTHTSGALWMIDADTGTVTWKTQPGRGETLLWVGFTPDGSLLMTGGTGNVVRLWDPATGELVGQLEGHRGAVDSVAFDAAGRLVAGAGAFTWGLSESNDRTVTIWDWATRTPVRTLRAPAAVCRPVFSPDGSRLAAPAANHHVAVWEVATGELVRFEQYEQDVRGVMFTSDDRLVIVSGGRVEVKDGRSGATIRILTDASHPAWSGSIGDLTISSDNRFVAATDDHRTYVWELDSGILRFTVPGYVSGGLARETIQFDASGDHILIGHKNEVSIWSTATGQATRSLPVDGFAGPSVIDAAGRFIAVASLTSVRRWNTHTGDDLLQFGRTRVFRDLTDEERRAYGLP